MLANTGSATDVRMYVIRPALRVSTGRPPARLIRGRRYPATPRLRSFHTTRQLAQASNPPSAPDSTPVDQNGANPSDKDKTAATEQEDAAVTAEDPEVLAQKLQRSRESARRYSAALRRQQRGKKAQGLPPVHIPDWFLKRRVVRREDQLRDQRQCQGLPVLSVALTHTESGEHAACAIPAGGDFDAVDVLSRLVRGLWSRRLDDNEKRKVEEYLQDNIALVEKAHSGDLQAQSQELLAKLAISTMAMHEDAFNNPSGLSAADARMAEEHAAKIDALVKKLHDPNVSAQDLREAEEILAKQDTKVWGNKAARKRNMAKTRQLGATRRISSLVVAEIRSTIAASLSTLRPETGDTFPSAKTNLILHSPSPEHEKSIDHIVLTTASDLGSDMITLHAQDLAHLGGDYLGEGSDPSPRSIRSLGYETYRLNAELSTAFEYIDETAEDESDMNSPSSVDASGWQPMRGRTFAIPLSALSPALRAMTQGLTKSTQFGASNPFDTSAAVLNDDSGKPQSQSELQLEDLKLAALLESLVDANDLKQNRGLIGQGDSEPSQRSDQMHKLSGTPAFFDYSMNTQGVELDFNSALPANARPGINMAVKASAVTTAPEARSASKIIYVKDFKELNATHYGGRIIQKLEELVRRRRASGERIMIVGSTCSRELTPELHTG